MPKIGGNCGGSQGRGKGTRSIKGNTQSGTNVAPRSVVVRGCSRIKPYAWRSFGQLCYGNVVTKRIPLTFKEMLGYLFFAILNTVEFKRFQVIRDGCWMCATLCLQFFQISFGWENFFFNIWLWKGITRIYFVIFWSLFFVSFRVNFIKY